MQQSVTETGEVVAEEAVTGPSFADLGLPEALAGALIASGIELPFPIQAATIPDALAGKDVSGKAPTGSGKTLAFGLPILAKVSKAAPHHPTAVVLVPTRELAAQVAENLSELAKVQGRRVRAIYGGAGFQPQIDALVKGVDILVATPGRLADLMEQKEVSLEAVEFAVVDEADRMADMGFLPQVRRILDKTNKRRQTLLFSATLDGDVDVLVKRYQNNPVKHEAKGVNEERKLEHHFWEVDRSLRTEVVAEVALTSWPAVVFCRTKHGSDRLARQLRNLGVSAEAIHGDLRQSKRESVLKAFTDGTVAALIATDVAARGIHVDDVACVIHYDLPETDKDYVHRSGRTGRAGATGVVISLVGPEMLSDARRLIRQCKLDVQVMSPQFNVLVETDGIVPPVMKSDPPPQHDPKGPGGGSGRNRNRNRSRSRSRNRNRPAA